jgi:hypothetical protein
VVSRDLFHSVVWKRVREKEEAEQSKNYSQGRVLRTSILRVEPSSGQELGCLSFRHIWASWFSSCSSATPISSLVVVVAWHCSAHVTIRSSSTFAFHFSPPIYPPTFSLNLKSAICSAKSYTDRTCRTWPSRMTAAASLYASKDFAARTCLSLDSSLLRQRTSGVYKSSVRTSKAVQFQPDNRELSFLIQKSLL